MCKTILQTCIWPQEDININLLAMSSWHAVDNLEIKAPFIIEAKEKMLENGVCTKI